MSVNPLEISHITNFIDKKSWPKYERYLFKFCSTMDVTKENPATANLVFEFLKNIKDKYAPTTTWKIFSCLNKFCQHLYDLNLNVSLI